MLFKISLAQIAISSKLVPWGRPSLTRMGERSPVRLHNRRHDMVSSGFPSQKTGNDVPFVGPR